MQYKAAVRIRWCVAILACVLLPDLSGQFRTETVSDHDVYNTVYRIAQDADGYIWMATNDGLIFHDAYKYYKIKSDPRNPFAIPKMKVSDIYCSRRGDLWVGSGGLFRYDAVTGHFIITDHVIDRKTGYSNKLDARCLQEDKDGRIWFTTGSIISCFDPGTLTYSNYTVGFTPAETSSGGESVNDLAIDRNNRLWVAYNRDRINCIDLNTGTCSPMNLPIDPFFPSTVNSVYCDPDQSVWLCVTDGLYLFNEQKKCFEKTVLNNVPTQTNFSAIIQLPDHTYWTATSSGLYRLGQTGHTLHVLQHIAEETPVSHFLYDRSGVLWMGKNEGAVKINLTQKPFHVFCEHKDDRNSLPGNTITAIYESADRKLWVGTTKGLACIDRSKGSIERFAADARLPHLLVSNKIFSIAEIGQSLYVAGTGLQQADFRNRCFAYAHPDPKDSSAINDWIVWDIHKGQKSGDTWLGTMSGFCRIRSITANTNPGEPRKMNASFEQFHYKLSTNGKDIACFRIYEDSQGVIWCCTLTGLLRYDPVNRQFKIFNFDPDFYSTSVKCILEDHKKRLWVGTDGAGLVLFTEKRDSFTTFRVKDGLPSDAIWGMEEDRNGNLWMSTNNGLCRYNPVTKTFRTYDVPDGIPGNEFMQGAFYQDASGEFFFGTTKGLLTFFPDSILDNPYPPAVAISSLYLFNRPVETGMVVNGDTILTHTIGKTKMLVLSHKNNVFSIGFTSLHYANPQKNRFRYRMEGFDADWSETGAERRIAHYTNLPAGEYTFRVSAENADGIRSKDDAVLKIIILPPFWKTWWFRTLVLLLILLSIWSIFRYRLRSLEQQKLKLEKTVTERTHQLKEANEILSQQKEELAVQTEKLQESNAMLVERQKEIEAASEEIRAQSEELYFTNEELKKLNATKDRFFSIIAHDLKNPFHAILSFADLLRNKYDEFDDTSKKEFINAIKDSSESAFKLLQNLLDWARSQTNKITLNLDNIDLAAIADETIKVLSLNADKKNIHLHAKMEPGSYAYADRNMITTVIRNIVNNAIKFTPENGSITITTKKHDKQIDVLIQDTGVGMSQQTIDNLFRIDVSHSTAGTSGESGTGLGLLICKDFVDKNNGQILVQSEPGRGTCFIIQLPAASGSVIEKPQNTTPEKKEEEIAPATEVVAETHSVPEPAELSDYTLLIVEDNANIRLSIKQLFAGRYTIYEAEDGQAGYEIAISQIPDLIISDVMMPRMNGFELCEKLKTDVATSHIPIILLTANADDNSKMKGLETGADDYQIKPFNPPSLLIRVRKLIETRNKLREIYSRQIVIEPSQITITTADEMFIRKAIGLIETNISETDFGVEQFITQMATGRTQLYKKIKEITGQSVNDFIRSIRLKRAAQILQQEKKGVAELAYMVGFNYPEYFSKCFKKEFGVLPTEYPGK